MNEDSLIANLNGYSMQAFSYSIQVPDTIGTISTEQLNIEKLNTEEKEIQECHSQTQPYQNTTACLEMPLSQEKYQ